MNLLNGSSSNIDLSLSCESLRDDEKLQNINPRRLKYERNCGLWSSFLPALELEENSPPHIPENMFEEPQTSLLKLHRGQKLEFTPGVFIEKQEVPYKDGDKREWCHDEVNIPVGEVRRIVCELDRQHKFSATSANTLTSKFDENENITDKKRSDSAPCVSVDDDKKIEGGAKELLVDGPTAEGIAEDKKLSNDQKTSTLLSSVSAFISSKLKSKESVNGQMKQETDKGAEKAAANRSYGLWYFTGKLSDVYKDAGRRLQDTRDIIQNVRVNEIKVVLSQYVTMVSKELPLINRMQPKPEPEPGIPAANKVSLVDRSKKDCALSLPQNCSSLCDPWNLRMA
ncbi:hypothetical protein E3U43_008561 [Larimichthys crocea]|uniref:Uncharacterized protein n=1 Tax=Larimichthys crocea TaxID=215358 RepID=A0ACD3RV41_LARCR|nr:hypothetical protein E3U43_008561 [Larimichthys crocea]